MRKWIMGIVKGLFIFLLLICILVGFSFFERGELAKKIASYVGISWNQKEMNHPHSDEGGTTKTDDYPNGGDYPDQSITIYSNVLGDILAKNVQIEGQPNIAGSVTATQSITAQIGTIQGDLHASRVMLGFVEPESDSDSNNTSLTIVGNIESDHITLGSNSIVTGNVGTEKSSVDIAGKVQGDVKGNHIILHNSAVIHGDVYIKGDSIIMETGAEVQGQFITANHVPLRIIKQDSANTQTAQDKEKSANQPIAQQSSYVDNNNGYSRFYGSNSWGLWVWIPMLIGIFSSVILVFSFFKNEVDKAIAHVTTTTWKAMWMGILSLVIGAIIIFLLSISIIGIPIAAVGLIFMISAIWVGFTAIISKVGNIVTAQFNISIKNNWIELLIGTLLLAHLVWLPIIGWIILAGILILGLGSIMSDWLPRLRSNFQAWRQKRKTKKDTNPKKED